LTERFDRYISDNSKSGIKGFLIVDKQTKGVDNEIRERVNDLLRNGILYHKFKRIFEEPYLFLHTIE
jgi:hypothetical protein